MASTPQCDNFVGNAWKKDLCLNCFKSKEEHQIKNGDVIKIPTKLPDPPKEVRIEPEKVNTLNLCAYERP